MLLLAALVFSLLGRAPDAAASPSIRVGLFDDAEVLYGNPDIVFPLLQQAGTKVLRVNLWWGGPNGVARREPATPANPADAAYNWATYDRTALLGERYGMKVMFTVIGTPGWANGQREWNVAPTDDDDIRDFAQAAATRYSGRFPGGAGKPIPAVRLWLVWNEPNNPVFLKPQFSRDNGRWVVQSARDYARMCNAVIEGVREGQVGGKIACGATAPRGNNNPNSSRPSVSPVAFLVAMRQAGARGFNAYAHHPYYGKKQETPTTPPPPGIHGNAPTAVTLGNFQALQTALNSTYGSRMRIWITEYGYQTNPPDRFSGVSWAEQRKYLVTAYGILRKDPRVDIFIWFLLRDEKRLEGWQSGLFTAAWKRKDAREGFERVAAGR
jgi:hypothetical protein